MSAAARGEDRAGREILRESVGLERGRHDDQLQVGAPRFLQLQSARERDVAVEMALVEFIEKNRRDAGQLGILEQLAQENSFGDEADAGLFRGDFFEANLVTDLVAEPAAPFERDAAGRASGWRGGAVAG